MAAVQVGARTAARNKENPGRPEPPPLAGTFPSDQVCILVATSGLPQARRRGGIPQNPQQGGKTVKVSPFHSKLPRTDRYHDESTCTLGDNIESYNKVSGTGGHPKCHLCKQISG